MLNKKLLITIGAIALVTILPLHAADCEEKAGANKVYTEHVKCEGKDCKVDIFLVKGFRAFSQCQVCHGLDANGSSFAPSLVEKLKEIDRARFDEVVINGYKGQVGVMPPWKENPNVMKKIDNLYAYLKARSDGVIPAGRLKRFDR
ncbi:MAG TPA: c-type cytochrome, methanol metabolism-related [Chromatiales bacterium]|nr:c-type cytochrome, methanol metabolism-related [Thiotrichales bacterium]HIP69537.1 c-type cytochrome, methanol metabolism-related [Chromatiales bacterium]